MIVQNSLEPYLVTNVKANQDLDSLLVDLKKFISKKSINGFPKGKMVSSDTMSDYVIQM